MNKTIVQIIDYQAGDVVVPRDTTRRPELLLVQDITEQGAVVSFLDYPDDPMLVPNHELYLLKKHSTGSLLYGKKG